MASIRIFPLARRADLVGEHVGRFLKLGGRAAEAALLREVQLQRAVLLDLGAAPAAVEREIDALAETIRRQVWRAVIEGDAA